MKENSLENVAYAQYLELKDILKSVGILDMTDREDFISKVWRIAAIENPRNNDVFWNNDQVIDFEFQDLTTSLCW